MASSTDYENVFNELDKDGSGQVTFDELITGLKAKGVQTPESELRDYFKSVAGNDGQLSKVEFLKAMGVIPIDIQEKVQGVFNDFDQNGNGYIEQKDLEALFAEMGKHMDEAQLRRMMQLMDADGDGKVNYEEFKQKFFGNI